MTANNHCTTKTEVLGQVSALLGQCIEQTKCVEDAVLDWLANEQKSASFPIVDFQRMDFIAQLQKDVVAVVDKLHDSAFASDEYVKPSRVAELIETVKLEHTRAHLRHFLGEIDTKNVSTKNERSDEHYFERF